MDKFNICEINVDEIEILEESVTPGFGILCGGGCTSGFMLCIF